MLHTLTIEVTLNMLSRLNEVLESMTSRQVRTRFSAIYTRVGPHCHGRVLRLMFSFMVWI